MRRAPLIFLSAVLLLLAYGAWRRFRTPGYGEALAEVLDGDPDRSERLGCLRVLVDQGLQAARGGDRRAGLVAAMAAVDLGEADHYRQALGLIEAPEGLAGAVVEPGAMPEVSLGEPYLAELLAGQQAEHARDPTSAVAHYQRCRRSAKLFHQPLAAELATAGLGRLR